MLHLDYRDNRPIHQQVRDGLRRLMVSGVLQPGDQLPSVRKLATELAINPNTIQRAMAQLEAEGKAQKLPFPLSMSIGTVVTDPESALSFADYVKIADSRMYEEKVQKRAARK